MEQITMDKEVFENEYVTKKAVAVDFLKLHSKIINIGVIVLGYSIVLVGFSRYSLMAGVGGSLLLGVACGLIIVNSKGEISRISSKYDVEKPKTLLSYFADVGKNEQQ